MSTLMNDGGPPPEEGTVQNIMTRNDMRKVRVRVTFTAKNPKDPPVRPRRWEFATTVMASEFMLEVSPPVGRQIGSPKQARARLSRLLRLTDPTIVTRYEIKAEVEGVGPITVGEDTETVVAEDTFVEGQTGPTTPEPVDVEAILNSDITDIDLDFPGEE